jgi:hypothetical protein
VTIARVCTESGPKYTAGWRLTWSWAPQTRVDADPEIVAKETNPAKSATSNNGQCADVI